MYDPGSQAPPSPFPSLPPSLWLGGTMTLVFFCFCFLFVWVKQHVDVGWIRVGEAWCRIAWLRVGVVLGLV